MADVQAMAVKYISSVVPAEGILLDNSSNNELKIINLATVRADGNSNSMPA